MDFWRFLNGKEKNKEKNGDFSDKLLKDKINNIVFALKINLTSNRRPFDFEEHNMKMLDAEYEAFGGLQALNNILDEIIQEKYGEDGLYRQIILFKKDLNKILNNDEIDVYYDFSLKMAQDMGAFSLLLNLYENLNDVTITKFDKMISLIGSELEKAKQGFIDNLHHISEKDMKSIISKIIHNHNGFKKIQIECNNSRLSFANQLQKGDICFDEYFEKDLNLSLGNSYFLGGASINRMVRANLEIFSDIVEFVGKNSERFSLNFKKELFSEISKFVSQNKFLGVVGKDML